MSSAIRRWWTQPDHYHWLTAFLAARGAQAPLQRAIAVTLAALGVLIVATIGSPSGPQGPISRAIAVAVAVCGAVMAACWLRGGWPSPRWSAVFSLTAGIAIAALCLVQGEPLAGLLASAGFAVLGGYIGFFHTPRLLAVNFAAAILTTTVLAWRLAERGDAAMAACAFGFLMLVNVATPMAMQAVVHLLGIDVLNSDIDPLTGLLNRQAFYRTAATFIATRDRADDRYFVIVFVSIDGVESAGPESREVERARVDVAQALRETTRRDTVTGHMPEADFMIADCFSSPDATPLVERVRNAVTTTPARSTASIGVVSAPMAGLAQYPPHALLDELIGVAFDAMREARRAGGDQVRHVVYPNIEATGDDPKRPSPGLRPDQ